jgi:hypothetical protein
MPADWDNTALRQVSHLIKWASLSFNLRGSVKIAKALLCRELGQDGYLDHIQTVYPVVQGHNLGKGKISEYDYRAHLRTIARWIQELGYDAIEQFKKLVGAVLDSIKLEKGKSMKWFFKLISFWFDTVSALKQLVKEKMILAGPPTTILESSIDYKRDRLCLLFLGGQKRGTKDRKLNNSRTGDVEPRKKPSYSPQIQRLLEASAQRKAEEATRRAQVKPVNVQEELAKLRELRAEQRVRAEAHPLPDQLAKFFK